MNTFIHNFYKIILNPVTKPPIRQKLVNKIFTTKIKIYKNSVKPVVMTRLQVYNKITEQMIKNKQGIQNLKVISNDNNTITTIYNFNNKGGVHIFQFTKGGKCNKLYAFLYEGNNDTQNQPEAEG